ncbi:hypothetical protein TEA_006560 [Camellia sinensis var. sinensis]|uniref:Piezo-type mechanosensitive ion channel homolog domain-containing protein n=1 Tax=Camellia sinensis var. sinensis TaxID=542762 RepID=A0A4S4E390_CAMSN|nr:hypothetical protein TEA_006560 [Camellia sinensis var. sinensis]
MERLLGIRCCGCCWVFAKGIRMHTIDLVSNYLEQTGSLSLEIISQLGLLESDSSWDFLKIALLVCLCAVHNHGFEMLFSFSAIASATTDASYEFVVTTTQHSIRDANNPARGDLDRVPFKGYGNYCRLGPDAWDEASVKLVLLDEADAMTKDAQFALRRVIEKYTKSTRFGLICNHVNKIIPALQSRCTRFQFAPLDAINPAGREGGVGIGVGVAWKRPDNLDNLRKLAEQFQKQAPGAGATAAPEDDDDQVSDLVAGETFEAAAEERNLILLRPCGS